ncbi:hypothetical protein ACFQX7_04750 [Luedemannella flava]
MGCHSLGLSTALLDLVGDDPQGELVRAECARRGVELHHQVNPAGTSRSVNLVDATGRRMSFYDGRSDRTCACPVSSTCRTSPAPGTCTCPSWTSPGTSSTT